MGTGNRWKVVRAGGTRTRRARVIYRHGLWRENVFYFRQGSRVPHLANRRPNMQRWKHYINYRNTGGRWPGFSRAHNFAVRWTGRVRFFRAGQYRFSLISDDGSKLFINNRYTINNDGLHGWRNRIATRHMRRGWSTFRITYFQQGGHAGILLRYRGPDTGNRWRVLNARGHDPMVPPCQCRSKTHINRRKGNWCHLIRRRCELCNGRVVNWNWSRCRNLKSCPAVVRSLPPCQCRSKTYINRRKGNWCYLIRRQCRLRTGRVVNLNWNWARCRNLQSCPAE